MYAPHFTKFKSYNKFGVRICYNNKKIQRAHVLKHLLKKSISISYFVHKEVCILPVIDFSIFIVTLKLKSDNN